MSNISDRNEVDFIQPRSFTKIRVKSDVETMYIYSVSLAGFEHGDVTRNKITYENVLRWSRKISVLVETEGCLNNNIWFKNKSQGNNLRHMLCILTPNHINCLINATKQRKVFMWKLNKNVLALSLIYV